MFIHVYGNVMIFDNLVHENKPQNALAYDGILDSHISRVAIAFSDLFSQMIWNFIRSFKFSLFKAEHLFFFHIFVIALNVFIFKTHFHSLNRCYKIEMIYKNHRMEEKTWWFNKTKLMFISYRLSAQFLNDLFTFRRCLHKKKNILMNAPIN